MSLMQICALSVLGAVVSVIWKSYKAEYSFVCGLAVCIMLFGTIIVRFHDVIDKMGEWEAYLGVAGKYLKLLLKMIGITYLCEFCSNICKDAGQHALAGQVELWGKLCIMGAGLPVIYGVMESIRTLI